MKQEFTKSNEIEPNIGSFMYLTMCYGESELDKYIFIFIVNTIDLQRLLRKRQNQNQQMQMYRLLYMNQIIGIKCLW